MDRLTLVTVLACLLCISAVQSFAPAKICFAEPDACPRCDAIAICATNTSIVVPRNLEPSTSHLNLSYQGPLIELDAGMFAHLPNLIELTIDCNQNIVSVKPETFANMQGLTYFAIYNTRISSLPDDLFHPDNSLQTLTVAHSELVNIPDGLLLTLPHVQELNLPHNRIVHTNCTSIGEKFEQLKHLHSLNLANMTVHESCKNILGPGFFSTIESKLQTLNLTMVVGIWNEPSLLSKFTKLTVLDISNVAKFSNCPSLAVDLFWNLPPSTENLIMGRWRSNAEASRDCFINETSITGLKSLAHLTNLFMRFSDMLFGPHLSASIFSGFQSLKHLDIGWCRFLHIENFAFGNCPSLASVSLEGNPLAARPVKLCRNSTQCPLISIDLARANIYSDFDEIYMPHELLQNSPVEEIDLEDNFLHRLPIFTNPSTPQATANLKAIFLGHNYLRTLFWNSVEKLGDYCHLLPKLTKISLENNRLHDLDGLCPTLTHLDISANFLNKDWKTAESHLVILRNIEVLDVSKNNIDNFTANAFRSMGNLTEVNLSENNLTKLSHNLFRHNHKLEVIDLHGNQLTEFYHWHITQLENLKRLNLEDNMITFLEPALTNYVQNSLTIEEFAIVPNPLPCSCAQGNVLDFIRDTPKVPKAVDLVCAGPTREIRGQRFYSYKRDNFYCDHRDNVIVAFSVLSAFLLTLLVALPCYKYRWYLSHARVVLSAIIKQAGAVVFEQKCLYDALILYNIESEFDSSWVVDHLFANTEEYGRSDDIQVCDFRIFVYVLFALILCSESNSLHWFMQLECFLDC